MDKRVDSLSTDVSSLSTDVSSLSTDVSDIKKMLEQVVANSNAHHPSIAPEIISEKSNSSANSVNVWDDPVRVENLKTKATIIIEKKTSGSDAKKDLEKVVYRMEYMLTRYMKVDQVIQLSSCLLKSRDQIWPKNLINQT